jgi:transcriptional regulator with XRE-family HTH domain
VKNPGAVKKFTAHLKKLRKQKGFSQQELADTANVAKKTVQRIERGKLNPTLDTLISLSEALEIPLKSLVDFE